MIKSKIIIFILTFFAMTLIAYHHVSAATIPVNSFAQSPGGAGDCTLGEAIEAANTDAAVDGCTAGSGADIITLQSGTYTLTASNNTTNGENGLPSVTTEMDIVGQGFGNTIIERDISSPLFRIFHIANTGILKVEAVRVRYGDATDGFIGGGFLNYGELDVVDCFIDTNTAASGGGIANVLDALNVVNCSIVNNEADTDTGGGIYNIAGTVSITDSTIYLNTADAINQDGGGIHNSTDGTLYIYDSTISNNFARDAAGGLLNSSNETVTIRRSTFNGNTANAAAGGGIQITSGTVTIINSTFSDNTAATGGGGIANPDGTLNLRSSTITDNNANIGGGIVSASSTVNLENTIIAGNTATTSGPDCSGTVTSLEYSLIGDDTNCNLPPGTGNIIDESPLLGPLADNGGPTQTHALLAGSRGVDEGDNSVAPATDQRGISRPQDGDNDGIFITDMGAYERRLVEIPTMTEWGMIIFLVLAGMVSVYYLRKKAIKG